MGGNKIMSFDPKTAKPLVTFDPSTAKLVSEVSDNQPVYSAPTDTTERGIDSLFAARRLSAQEKYGGKEPATLQTPKMLGYRPSTEAFLMPEQTISAPMPTVKDYERPISTIPKILTPEILAEYNKGEADNNRFIAEHFKQQQDIGQQENANKLKQILGAIESFTTEPIKRVATPIAEGEKQIGKSFSSGKPLRIIGNILAGGVKTGLNALPPVMALNAIQPVISQSARKLGESMGVNPDVAEQVANKITPFVFGLPVGIGSLASEEVTKLLDSSGALDGLGKEDKALALDLVQNGLFFGIAGFGGRGIEKGKEYFKEKFNENQVPLPKKIVSENVSVSEQLNQQSVSNKPEATQQLGLDVEKPTIAIADPLSRSIVNSIENNVNRQIKAGKPIDEKIITSKINDVWDRNEQQRLGELYQKTLEYNRKLKAEAKNASEIRSDQGINPPERTQSERGGSQEQGGENLQRNAEEERSTGNEELRKDIVKKETQESNAVETQLDNNVNAIKQFTEQGKTPEEISTALNLPVREVNKTIASENIKQRLAEEQLVNEQQIEKPVEKLHSEDLRKGEDKGMIPAKSPEIPTENLSAIYLDSGKSTEGTNVLGNFNKKYEAEQFAQENGGKVRGYLNGKYQRGWIVEESLPKASSVSKEPWEMTAKEWDNERENLAGKNRQENFTRKSGSEEVARLNNLKNLLYGVTDEASSKMKQAAKEEITLTPEEVKRYDERLNTPVTHRDVVEKALSEGKQVPENVLADYPDLAEKYKVADITNMKKEKGAGAPSKELYNKENLSSEIRNKFRLSKDQADTSAEIFDARATAWAKANNRPKNEYYKTRIASIERGGIPSEGALYQDKPYSPIWYSKLEKVITDKAPNKNINPESLKSMLKNSGVKDEEIKWMDVDGYLKENPKVTKQELIDYVKSNQVEIKEVPKGNKPLPDTKGWTAEREKEEPDEIIDETLKMFGWDKLPNDTKNTFWRVYDEKGNWAGTASPTIENEKAAIKDVAKFITKGDPTKFSEWKTPGGKNYREVLMTLPEKSRPNLSKWDFYKSKGYTEEEFQKLSDIEQHNLFAEWQDYFDEQNKKSLGNFQSSHWDEPNVLAHVRLQDFTDSEGRKILLVDEVQSDWHEKGRKEGYVRTADNYEIIKNTHDTGWSVKDKNTNEVINDYLLSEKDATEWIKNHQLISENKVPDAPFKTNWHEFALKRVLRMAAEEGYDGIALTKGEQQAGRYDLSKQIKELNWYKDEKGFGLNAVDHQSKTVLSKEGLKEKDLEDIVGKDVAKEIIENSQTKDSGRLTGDDLKVGGEGMKGFYDKMIPSFLDKYAKKWGAKVGETIINAEGLDFDSWLEQKYPNEVGKQLSAQERIQLVKEWKKQIGDNSTKVHFLPVTDAMKRSVLFEGQPLFQDKKGSIEFLRDNRAIIRALENPDVSTVIHEMGHIFRKDLEGNDLKTIENWAGVKGGKWEKVHEEKFARGFEKYLADGDAPIEKLKVVFEKFKNWMGEIYKKITGSQIDIKINKQVRNVFDNLFKTEEKSRTPKEGVQTSLISKEKKTTKAEQFSAQMEPERTKILEEQKQILNKNIESLKSDRLKRLESLTQERDKLVEKENQQGYMLSNKERADLDYLEHAIKTEQAKVKASPESLAKGSPESKRIISQESYQQAKKNIIEKSSRLSAGIDPTLLKDLITVGAYHFENGARTFIDYSKRMIEEFGEKVKPYLKDVWEQMKENHPELQKVFSENKKASESTETKVRGLAKSTEAEAIASGIVKDIADLPEYEVRPNDPQIKVAADILANDLERAKRIEFGQEVPPDNMLPGFIHTGLKKLAIDNNDTRLMKEIATSEHLAKEATTAGQFIQALGKKDPLDPITAMRDIVKTRQKSPSGKRNETLIKSYDNKIESLEKKIKEKDEEIAKIQAEKAVKKIQRENEFQTRKEKRVYTKEQLHIERKDLYAQLLKTTAKNYNIGSAFGGLNTEAIKILGEITRNYVREGITDVSQIVDAIHKEVKDAIEGITPRDIRDAISGYGRNIKKTRNELQASVMDLRRQMQTISKIEDIEAGKTLIKSEEHKNLQSQELLKLKDELKSKLKEYGITEQESLSKSKNRIQKSLQEYKDKIAKGDYAVKEKAVSPMDAEKAKLQKELSDVREQYKNIQKNLGENLTDAEAKQIAGLSKVATEAKIKMDNSIRREPLKPATEEELQYGRARIAFAEYVDELKASANKLTWAEFKAKPISTILGGIKHIPGITKSAKATLDNSGLFNQHLKVLWTHPTIWGRNALKSFQDIAKVIGGKNMLTEISADIVSRPNYDLYRKDGLAIGTIEEAFPDSKLLEKIPYLGRIHKAADTAFTGLAYRNRADLYDLYTEIAKKAGHEETTGLGLGKLANSLTGRGNLGAFEKSGNAFNVLIFAPRLVKSHWDVLTAHLTDKDVSSFVKKEAAKNLLKIIGGSAAVMASANAMLPGSVETDPRSADFGSIKVGNTRFHFMGGMNSLTTLGSRLLTLSSKSTTTGEINKLNSGKFGSQTGWDALLNFGEGKLAPVAGLARDVMKGQTFGGGRLTFGGELQNLIVPLPITNVQEFLNDPKSANVVIGVIADAMGIFTNTYSNDPSLRKVRNTMLRADKEKSSNEQIANFRKLVSETLKNGSITSGQAREYIEQFNELQKEGKGVFNPDPALLIKYEIKNLNEEIKQREDLDQPTQGLYNELDKKENELDRLMNTKEYLDYEQKKAAEKDEGTRRNEMLKRVQNGK